ncbi:fluoride efflux transporter FluC [Allonocardiopsis opalescens]|uniref:Fluoride-specific ion channel FluC n=1 Tax=Allonocardiopsis opalescens TaxID=1144618 RepID=A0A2T0Q6J2_9ACTN|nr:CrcB family protein [Allonocardiopsis opalescens]PRX99411.1 camphor resistance protein CrcB [Allonocardiopsis opalescens]
MTVLLAVFAGGALGAAARHLVDRLVHLRADRRFPWGILAVNITGCLLFGLIGGLAAAGWPPAATAGLTAGLCGGFTTFSTFAHDTAGQLRAGRPAAAAANAVLSTGGGLAAAALGLLAASALAG